MRHKFARQAALFVGLLIIAIPSFGQIAVNSSSSSSVYWNGGSTANLTFAHTVAGSQRVLVVGTSMRINKSNNAVVGSVTYAGSPLTFAGFSNYNDKQRAELWYLVAPPVGTANVVVTLANVDNGKEVGLVAGATSFTGVDQVAPIGTVAAAGAKSTSASVNVTSATGEMVIDSLSTREDTSTTAGAGQTQRWGISSGSGGDHTRGAASTKAGSATTTMSWALGSNEEWALVAMPLKPSRADLDGHQDREPRSRVSRGGRHLLDHRDQLRWGRSHSVEPQ